MSTFHLFMAKELVDRIDLNIVCLVTSLRVLNPVGGYATLGRLCRDVILNLFGYAFLCDLHVFDYLGFGFILDITGFLSLRLVFCVMKEKLH